LPLSHNGKYSVIKFQYISDPDDFQNLTVIPCSKIIFLLRSAQWFLCEVADKRKTDKRLVKHNLLGFGTNMRTAWHAGLCSYFQLLFNRLISSRLILQVRLVLQRRTYTPIWCEILIGQMSFLSPNQEYQST